MRIVSISQLFGGAGLAAGITVGWLIARNLFELTSLTGVPTVLFKLGSVFTAYMVRELTQRIGRRTGLALLLLPLVGIYHFRRQKVIV